ncbi:MAG TPA: AbrB/MazE/SpoVT family DNA-binding domain-containing protein [Fimbriimonas sp.]|nr:AbrB/MazE/SpoVT family DNA-binding domain-containing protein [Fimbriimonas sp.]
MIATKLSQVGNSTGLVLPKELLSRLGLAKGDTVYLFESDLGLVLSPYDPKLAKAMEVVEEGERKYRNALHELAK